MERDVKAIKELLRVVEASAAEAKILSAAGASIPERFKWDMALLHFKNLAESVEWVVKNTEAAIAAEAAKRAAD